MFIDCFMHNVLQNHEWEVFQNITIGKFCHNTQCMNVFNRFQQTIYSTKEEKQISNMIQKSNETFSKGFVIVADFE